MPSIWRNCAENNIEVDSTLSYADHEGFRCGTGSEFLVFDIDVRKKLPVRERPLIVMECTLINYRKVTTAKILPILKYYNDIAVRYKMPLTILFHNSIFWKSTGVRTLNRVYADFFDN